MKLHAACGLYMGKERRVGGPNLPSQRPGDEVVPNPSCIPDSHPLLLGTGHYLSPGGGEAEDLGLNIGEI